MRRSFVDDAGIEREVIRAARVVSVNVGLPREAVWRGSVMLTGIFKEPVDGRVRASGINLDGDRQADLSVHGGPDKAVYVYPAEHYSYWQETLGRDLPWGAFGENLTVEGAPLEDEIAIGDTLRVGTAEFVVTQPRLPCFKLGIRFNDAAMTRRFLLAGRSGYYLRIASEGYVETGDQIEIVRRHPAHVPVSEITSLFSDDPDRESAIGRLLALDSLPEVWRNALEQTE